MGKRWRIHPHDPGHVSQLQRGTGCPAVVAQLLWNRGFRDPHTAREFLEARLSQLRDPHQLPGVTAAAHRLAAAAQSARPITVYGDYDADGMTGTAILVRCLQLLGAQVRYYIPHRMDEGYGLHCGALEQLARDGTQMVVTVDCGITSVQQAETARRLGLELIITDHHEMADRLPAADVLVHPRLPGGDYPFPGLCGAGVAFKLGWAVCQQASRADRVAERFKNFLLSAMGLAAIGTVADVVPLVDENRLLVRHGLNSLREYPLVGLQALQEVTGLHDRPRLSSEDIAFSLAPRLNAAGRLGQAELAVELMTTDDADRARVLAGYLQELNSSRDGLERSIYLAASKQIKEVHDSEADPAFVLAGRGWHAGVIGIVAGRLAEKFCRPCVLIALDELGQPVGTGSARTAGGLDLHRTLSRCAEHLITFGGHAAAAGLRIEAGRIEAFRRNFLEQAAAIAPENRVAEVRIDAEAPLPQLTLRTVTQIEQLAPFGAENPRPILCATGVRVDGQVRRMGAGERHLALSVRHSEVRLRAVAFGQAEWCEPLASHSDPIDIAYRPVINEFRGRRSVELQLVDWRPTHGGEGVP